MTLQHGATLQCGKYKIEKVLGQGGFGITYLAIQSGLERKVAIKEFFMKELCVRDDSTSHVTLGTEGSRETIGKFKDKFLKEARNIAKFSHPNIVHIIDVFEENGTAYYVMEYVGQGSLADKVKNDGYLSEPMATKYVTQVAQALDYIHQRKMNHLDVKPANVMLDVDDNAVLIDFGLSKQYDEITGNQTSTTPVGISEGYAPMEQYKKGGVGEFSPETDIYALGATFFKLLTGMTPPSASDIYEDGVPVDILKTKGISDNAISIICKAMEGRKKDRMKSVKAFIDELTASRAPAQQSFVPDEDESTAVIVEPKNRKDMNEIKKNEVLGMEKQKSNRKWLGVILGAVVIACAAFWIGSNNTDTKDQVANEVEETEISSEPDQVVQAEEPTQPSEEELLRPYLNNPRDLFEPKTFSSGNNKVLYQEALVYKTHQPRRLVIFLHGSNGKGTDNMKPLELEPGPKEIVKYLINKNDFSCYVLVPQLASGSWDSQCGALKALIEHYIATDSSIDKNRVYVCGTSLGGLGTWSMVSKYPNFFKGAMPVAARMSGSAANYKGTKICYVTGAAEGNRSQDAQALEKAGVDVKYWFRSEANHGWTCQSSFTKENLDWLFE